MAEIKHKTKPQLLESLVSVDILRMGPLIGPSIGAKIPMYYNIRQKFSEPAILDLVGKEMSLVIKKLSVDVIAAIEMSGIPWATTASTTSRMPMVVVRKEKREGARSSIEGVSVKGKTCVLIDDAYVGGAGKKRSINMIEDEGGKVSDILVILNVHEVVTGGYDLGRSVVDEKGINVHYFFSYLDWYRLANKKGLLSDELLKFVEQAHLNLKAWQKDDSKWQLLEDIKKKQNGKFI
ncbi:orotate phosphoribosyltransferase [Patescibacteria group bacterium]